MEEKILWKGRRSRKSYIFSYFLALIFLILGAIVFLGFFPSLAELSIYVSLLLVSAGLVLITSKELKRILVKYTLTTSRIIKEEGIINKKMDYIPYQMIEKISLTNKWYERILRTGSLVVDTGEENFTIETVDRPEKLEEIINKATGKFVYRQQSSQQPVYRRGTKNV